MRFLKILLYLNLVIPLVAWGRMIRVSGNVSGEWVTDTVLVTGEIQIPSGMGLSIVSGVEVLFTGDYKLIVMNAAGFQAVGTAADPIRFDWYYPDQYWHGIRFLEAADTSRLEYCIIKHGYASGPDNDGGGIQIDHCSPTITYCEIDSCKADDDGGGIWGTNSNSEISFCTITNNFAQYGGGGIYFYNSNILITDNYIANNWADDDVGGVFIVLTTVNFMNNTVTDNWAHYHGGGVTVSSSPGLGGIISNNTISYNYANYGCAGGLENYISNPTIENNLIIGNFAAENGGGIYLQSNLESIIKGNLVLDNASNEQGAGIFALGGPYQIIENEITDNYSLLWGGGIFCNSPNNTFQNNFIANNSSGPGYNGGGLYLSGNANNQLVIDNIISGNSAHQGGGVYIHNVSNLQFIRNNVTFNHATLTGGGVFFYTSNGLVNKCTIRNNTSASYGGLYFQSTTIPITNTTVRGNSAGQIGGYTGEVTYSNIEGGWAGVGNIDENPMFATIAQPHGNILWGSPCIDAGNPYGAWDPDSTIADIGANYYNQSIPLRILVTPYDAPLLIPSSGGSFNFLITVSNCTGSDQTANIWCDVELPDGSTYGPVIGLVTASIPANTNLSKLRTQDVPAFTPGGIYEYRGYAVVGADTSVSTFIFTKLGTTDGDEEGEWHNWGEEFEGLENEMTYSASPDEFALYGAHPNPFNASTVIGFELPVAGQVKLEVFDVCGRSQRSPLQNGWLEAGYHEVSFDGSGLASGIYIYRLEAGEFMGTGKMVLLK